MNDLSEALARHDRHETDGWCCTPDAKTIAAAARNWHTLPDQVDVVAQAIKPYIDVDPAIDPNEWGLAQLHTARIAAKAAVDALTDTANGDVER